ncbi:phosphoribosylformylglycinamidine synthase I [Aeromonas phage vB_AsaP_MQM1]|nr:phosphoribosylformylglycinamidine synthase I [Aeromonas phage vB_AsaP_MQM1]
MSKVSNATEITRGNFASIELDAPSTTLQFAKSAAGRIGTYEGKRVILLSGNAILLLGVEELSDALVHLEDDGTLGIPLEAGQEALRFADVKAQVEDAIKGFEELNPMGPIQTLKFAALGDPEGAFAVYPDAETLADVNEAMLNELMANVDPFTRMMLQMGMMG